MGKGKAKNLNLKAITMIYPVTGWFEVTQYNYKERYQPQT